MNRPNQLVIVGGGASIREGVEKGLWEKLENQFVIGINFSYKFFPNATIQCYLDKQVREQNLEDFLKLDLVITKLQPTKNHQNEIQIPTFSNYNRDIQKGIWKGSLTGIYALTLGIYLLDEGEIFLLGYDFGDISGIKKPKEEKALTHFYQGTFNHRGVGRVGYYNSKGHADRDFSPFKEEKKVKIYNVSLNSKINVFEKISYDEFFKKLDRNKYNQEELRRWIKASLPNPLPTKLKKNKK